MKLSAGICGAAKEFVDSSSHEAAIQTLILAIRTSRLSGAIDFVCGRAYEVMQAVARHVPRNLSLLAKCVRPSSYSQVESEPLTSSQGKGADTSTAGEWRVPAAPVIRHLSRKVSS